MMSDELKQKLQEELILLKINYIEKHSGYTNKKQDLADAGFIEMAKMLARELKANLIKVEDDFGFGEFRRTQEKPK